MVTIYDFNAYRSTRLLRSFSRQAVGVSGQLSSLNAQLNALHTQLNDIQETYDTFHSQLGRLIVKLNKTNKKTQTCLAACEMNSIEQMVKTRDKIVHDRHAPIKNKRLNIASPS